jgi:hypothetical protein
MVGWTERFMPASFFRQTKKGLAEDRRTPFYHNNGKITTGPFPAMISYPA